MSDYEKHHEKMISYGTGFYILVIFILIFNNWDLQNLVLDYFQEITGIEYEFIKKEIFSIGLAGGFGYAIGYFLTAIRFHDFVDHTFFKVRKNVDKFIVKTIRENSNNFIQNQRFTHDEVMCIFYELIKLPQMDNLRKRAFDYWWKYYVCSNIIFLSVISYITFYVLNILGNRNDIYIDLSIFMIFLFVGFSSFIAFEKFTPKLTTKIAKPQLDVIIQQHHDELIKFIQNKINHRQN